MNSRLSACVLGLIAGLLLTGPASGRELAAIQADGTIQIATEGATPPFNFYEGGQLKGFDVDIAEAIAAKMKLKVKWVTLPFDSLLVGLDQNRFDVVVAGHGITAERQKAVDFSAPYVCSGAAIIAKPGGAKTVQDLKGKVVGVQVGTTYLEAVKKVEGVGEVRTFPKDTDALQNLLADRTAVWVSDKLTAADALLKNPQAGNLSIGELLFEERYGMPVKKGNASLLKAIDGALAAVLADGTYASISNKWFARDIRCP